MEAVRRFHGVANAVTQVMGHLRGLANLTVTTDLVNVRTCRDDVPAKLPMSGRIEAG